MEKGANRFNGFIGLRISANIQPTARPLRGLQVLGALGLQSLVAR